MSPPPENPFAWLLDPKQRRAALREAERAVRGGWLDTAAAARRVAFVATLEQLLEADLPEREASRLAKIVAALAGTAPRVRG